MAAITGFVAAATLAFTPIQVDGLFLDGFAGGGGASTGIEQAIGRSVDIAINHSETAIAIHKANHPETNHYCTDIRMPFLPKQSTGGRYVAGAWFSPDCKEFSKAKGGPVKDRSIRALCWEVVHWLKETRPTCGYLENVEEFEYAAPLDVDGRPMKGQEGREFKRFVRAIRALGYRVQWRILRACDYGTPTSRKRLYMVMRNDGKPIVWPKATHGAPGSAGVRSGRLLPYRTAAECIDWSIPCPSIFGRKRELADATKRRIAHGVMRFVVNAAQPFIIRTDMHQSNAGCVYSDGEPLRTLTGSGGFAAVDAGLVSAPHVASMANRDKPFTSPNEPMHTIVATGTKKVAVDTILAPFTSFGQQGGRNRPADVPHSTIAASAKDTNGIVGATLVGVGGRRGQSPPMPVDGTYPTTTAKGDNAIAVATMVKMGNGEREGQAPRALDVGKPLGVVTAKGSQAAAVTALLSSFYGSDKRGSGGDPESPLRSIRAGGQHHAVVAANMAQFNNNPGGSVNAGHDMREVVSTLATKGPHQGVVETTLLEDGQLPPEMMERAVKVAAFLVKYYATDGENEVSQVQAADRSLDTITTLARFAVVTVTIDAKTYVIVDIGLRMLKPRELARAQGFPESYVLNPTCWYTTKPSKKFPLGQRKYGPLPIAEQIAAIGNSVCPPVARALILANQPSANDNPPLLESQGTAA